jgi:hypothetical protein
MAVHSDDYQKTLQAAHAGRNPQKLWGTTGARNVGDHVCKLLEHRRGYIKSVLDFGAGQRSLGKYVKDNGIDLRVQWTDYDPGIPEISVLPRGPFDAVVSSDVLEHVEPELVDETIDQLFELAGKLQFHHIACSECGTTLPDGRNAHLTVEEPKWWLAKFDRPGWTVMYFAEQYTRRRGKLTPEAVIIVEKDGS